jgi:hypothetical protein
MPNFFSGGPSQTNYRLGGQMFGLGGGGGRDQSVLADYLRSLGIDIPVGMGTRAFTKGQLLSTLLGQMGQPTGLENLYGPEFQGRAVASTVARTSQPFAEAGRALTSGFLRTGQGGGGQLVAGRERLARAQGQTQGSAITDFLMQLEGLRGGNIQAMEGIRQNRLAALANFISQQQVGHQQNRAMNLQEEQAAGAGIGGGVGGILKLLVALLS